VQIGVRHVRLAALSVAGPDDETWPVRFPTPGSPAELRRALARLLPRVRRTAGCPATALALSIPGVIDEAAARVLKSPNLPWMDGVPLGELFAGRSVPPLVVVQEIRALALGQLRHDPDRASFLLVDVGEGVGGAVVWRGKLFDPPLPVSGELGHSPVPGNTRKCGCGAIGCLETLVSRRGMLRSFAAAGRQRRVLWSQLVAHVHERGVEPWLAPTLAAAGQGVGAALNLLGVSQVVLTGALSELGPPALDAVAAAIRQSALWGRFGTLDVSAAPRRRAAGLVVAAVDRVLLASPR
jgi:predicted NBD/HSP70 family sugar kinase